MIPAIERQSTAEIIALQEEKLRQLLQYLNSNSPYYKNLFSKLKINLESIQTLADLSKIPTTSKTDLQENNDAFFCVAKEEIIDFATTSGTLGSPVIFGLTDKDLDRLAYNESISFACAGIKKGDVVQLMTTMDRRFMAGLAYFLGLRKLGASAVRVGAGIPELQWDSILKFKPKYLVSVPSFLLKLIDYAEKNNIDINKSGVEGVICIGEALRNQDFSPSVLTKMITDKWDIKLFSTYASTEMSTAFTECEAQIGGHHHPELIITEVLDENEQAVKAGESGELTITTLGIEAMPLLRFKTGDVVIMHEETCSCGRNTKRVGPVLGRKKHMIKYKGTTLYPTAMHDLLACMEDVQSHLIEISTNEIGMDEISIKISSRNPSTALLEKIKDHFKAKLRVVPSIEFIDAALLQKINFAPMSRKPIMLIDNRK